MRRSHPLHRMLCTCLRTSFRHWACGRAIRSDLAADESAKRYALATAPQLAAKPAANPYRYHSLDFLTNAYLQLAQDKRALAIVDQRNSVAELSPDFRYSAHTAFAAIPVRMPSSAARGPKRRSCRRRTRPIRKLRRSPGSGGRSVRHNPRISTGARRDAEEIARLQAQLAVAQDSYWAEQVAIQAEAAKAWIALGEGNVDSAIASMRAAADREDRTEKGMSPWRTGSRRCANCWVSCCLRRADQQKRNTNSSFR